MASFMSHEVFEPVDLSMFQGKGNGPQVSKYSAMGLGQSMTITMPSGALTYANEEQHKAILGPRRCRAGAKARRGNGPVKVKKPRARDYYGRFLAKNGIVEGCMPRDTPQRDSKGRFVATKGNERGVGVNPYDSIVNLQAPDFTTLLRVMNCGRYGTKGARHYHRIARLRDPDFTSLLNAMNNIGYEAVVDDGPYDVLKVLLQADAGTRE